MGSGAMDSGAMDSGAMDSGAMDSAAMGSGADHDRLRASALSWMASPRPNSQEIA
jgi:hypothetical protein